MAAERTPHPTAHLLPVTGTLWRMADLTDQGVRLRYGCYARGSEWEQQPQRWRNLQIIHAHALATRTTSAGGFRYSHTSGARLHRLHLWNVDTRVHLTQAIRPSKGRHSSDVVCHTGKVAAAECALVEGLRTTTLERTVVDCCLILAYRQSLILMDHALRLGADRGVMEGMAADLAGRRGVKNLRRVLATADPRSESPGETLTRDLLVRLNLPMPEAQVEVRGTAGPIPVGLCVAPAEGCVGVRWPDQVLRLPTHRRSSLQGTPAGKRAHRSRLDLHPDHVEGPVRRRSLQGTDPRCSGPLTSLPVRGSGTGSLIRRRFAGNLPRTGKVPAKRAYPALNLKLTR